MMKYDDLFLKVLIAEIMFKTMYAYMHVLDGKHGFQYGNLTRIFEIESIKTVHKR